MEEIKEKVGRVMASVPASATEKAKCRMLDDNAFLKKECIEAAIDAYIEVSVILGHFFPFLFLNSND